MHRRSFGLSLLLLLLFTSVSWTADVRVALLKGAGFNGELVDINDTDIVVRSKGANVKTPLANVLSLDIGKSRSPAGPFNDIELTDGSLLHCASFALKPNQLSVKLLTGQNVQLPLAKVVYILRDAHKPANRQEWQALLKKQGTRDLLGVKKEERISALEGTFGAVSQDGSSIEFLLGDIKRPIPVERIHAFGFLRQREAVSDRTLCKAYDATGNLLIVEKIAKTGGNYTLTTVSGMTIEYPVEQLAKLDFSKGKLTFLSDLEPEKVIEKSALGGINHYRRDKNLDGGPIRLRGKVYSKGLALHAYTEIVYNIGGEYKEFKTILGVDDNVGGDSQVKVIIEGDGRQLFATELKRKDKKVIPVAVNVTNVNKLRIVVESLNLFDLGDHVDLADAKVTK